MSTAAAHCGRRLAGAVPLGSKQGRAASNHALLALVVVLKESSKILSVTDPLLAPAETTTPSPAAELQDFG